MMWLPIVGLLAASAVVLTLAALALRALVQEALARGRSRPPLG